MNTHLDQEKVFLSDWYVDKILIDVGKDAAAFFLRLGSINRLK